MPLDTFTGADLTNSSPGTNGNLKIGVTMHPSQVPAVVIPDIFQQLLSIRYLLEELYCQSKLTMDVKHPTTTFRPIFYFTADTTTFSSIKIQSQEISKKIDDTIDISFPLILVAISHGVHVATGVAKLQQENGRDVHLILLDSPSPELIKNRYDNHKELFIKEAIKITNVAAKMAGLNNFLDDKEFTPNKTVTLETLFEDFITLITKKNLNSNPDQIQDFTEKVQDVKRKLNDLIYNNKDYQATTPIDLKQVTLFFTEETKNQYNIKDETLGWSKHFNNIEIIHDDILEKLSHTDILCNELSNEQIENLREKIPEDRWKKLQEEDHGKINPAKRLAANITDTVNQHIKLEDLIAIHQDYISRMYALAKKNKISNNKVEKMAELKKPAISLFDSPKNPHKQLPIHSKKFIP